ncbi:MAG: hypothetical protein Q9159_004218 [Coniocarpon cinnabarinum]
MVRVIYAPPQWSESEQCSQLTSAISKAQLGSTVKAKKAKSVRFDDNVKIHRFVKDAEDVAARKEHWCNIMNRVNARKLSNDRKFSKAIERFLEDFIQQADDVLPYAEGRDRENLLQLRGMANQLWKKPLPGRQRYSLCENLGRLIDQWNELPLKKDDRRVVEQMQELQEVIDICVDDYEEKLLRNNRAIYAAEIEKMRMDLRCFSGDGTQDAELWLKKLDEYFEREYEDNSRTPQAWLTEWQAMLEGPAKKWASNHAIIPTFLDSRNPIG